MTFCAADAREITDYANREDGRRIVRTVYMIVATVIDYARRGVDECEVRLSDWTDEIEGMASMLNEEYGFDVKTTQLSDGSVIISISW